MIFIHIPKTAGTSFRLGASDYFGPHSELRDYGEDVKATSPLVTEFVHKRKDYKTFRKKVDQLGIKFICGHFPSEKYLSYFDKGTFVTFVRDPVQRVVSEFHHAVRINARKESLKDFCQHPRQINRQWKFLRAIGIENMAFVGLTERYEASLDRINAIFDTDIPLMTKNLGKKTIEEKYLLDSKDADLIRSLNAKDFELYDSIKAGFENSIQQQLLPATGDRYVGKVGGVRDGKIFGWVVNRDREIPVEVSVFINGQIVGNTLANRYRPDLQAAGIKRSGNGGILYDLNGKSVKERDVIEFREKESGNVIGKRILDSRTEP